MPNSSIVRIWLSLVRPNKRVQRTRLRSPLTRHPLGGSSAAEDLVA